MVASFHVRPNSSLKNILASEVVRQLLNKLRNNFHSMMNSAVHVSSLISWQIASSYIKIYVHKVSKKTGCSFIANKGPEEGLCSTPTLPTGKR